MHHRGICPRLWRFDPEFAELRELLPLGGGSVQCQTTGRQPVDMVTPDGAEVAGTLIDRVFRKDPRRLQLPMQPQTGIAQRVIHRRVGPFVGRVKHAHIKHHLPRLARCAVHGIDRDRRREVEAGGKELHMRGSSAVAPQRVAGVEPDFAILVVGNLQPGLRHPLRRLIILGGQSPRLCQHRFRGENRRLSQGDPRLALPPHRRRHGGHCSTQSNSLTPCQHAHAGRPAAACGMA